MIQIEACLGDADSEVPRDVRNQADYGELRRCEAEGGYEQGDKRQGRIDLPATLLGKTRAFRATSKDGEPQWQPNVDSSRPECANSGHSLGGHKSQLPSLPDAPVC
jgi:hypothetical protein